jgi:hypothetical protein
MLKQCKQSNNLLWIDSTINITNKSSWNIIRIKIIPVLTILLS